MNPVKCIAPPITRDQWVRIVSRHEHPIEHQSVQRRGSRFRVRGFARLWVEVDTGFRTVTVAVGAGGAAITSSWSASPWYRDLRPAGR
jgi:hypothetical protein